MKRLRASEQGDSGASGVDAGAAADPNAPSGTSAPPVGGGISFAASLKAALSEKVPDTQTATTPALPPPSEATQEEQQQARCNGGVLQMPQRKED